jgi:hypothetical protein
VWTLSQQRACGLPSLGFVGATNTQEMGDEFSVVFCLVTIDIAVLHRPEIIIRRYEKEFRQN